MLRTEELCVKLRCSTVVEKGKCPNPVVGENKVMEDYGPSQVMGGYGSCCLVVVEIGNYYRLVVKGVILLSW